MPAQQGLWLNDEEGLLPGSNQPGQQDKEHAIGFRACWPFHLPSEDDELVAQESVFRDKLGLVSAKVGERSDQEGASCRFRPTYKAKVKHIQTATLQPQKIGRASCRERV